jgi:hypothetical protein
MDLIGIYVFGTGWRPPTYRQTFCCVASTRTWLNQMETRAVEEENAYFRKIVAAFRNYKRHALTAVDRKQEQWRMLPAEHRKCTQSYLQKLDYIRFYIESNALFISQIVPNVT